MEKVLLNGETFTKGWLTPHDQIFLTVPETAGVPTVAYIAVLLIGLTKPLMALSPAIDNPIVMCLLENTANPVVLSCVDKDGWRNSKWHIYKR